MPPGIFPYLGGSVSADQLQSFLRVCGSATVSGKQGAKVAAKVDGVLVDPAIYALPEKSETDCLFDDYDAWLIRQRSAGVPIILTDTPRIPKHDRSALRKALSRWDTINEPTMVVLPLEPWWLKGGLPLLAAEVRAAGRPVAVVLMASFNGLDVGDAVTGLLTFIAAVGPVPVTLLRCDISAVGAVAHGAFAGFVGWSTNTRHGPVPMRRREHSQDDADPDNSPTVYVPVLHDYFKASKLPAFARSGGASVVRCGDLVCQGSSLLNVTQLAETDLPSARLLACRHNVASTERIARQVFSSTEPRDVWWEICQRGANETASLAQGGISLATSPWLRQWLQLGSPAHEPQAAF